MRRCGLHHDALARRGRFPSALKADKDVALAFSAAELEGLFDLGHHLKQVDTVFERVFGQ
jgi:adenylosuccinate lyase